MTALSPFLLLAGSSSIFCSLNFETEADLSELDDIAQFSYPPPPSVLRIGYKSLPTIPDRAEHSNAKQVAESLPLLAATLSLSL